MCVRPEERSESSNVIPPHEHLWLGIAKETADVSYKKVIRSRYKDMLDYSHPSNDIPAILFASTI